MTKVGHDLRLKYYQQTVDEVVAELRSHPYGLTTPEAKRRLAQNGANQLRLTRDTTERPAFAQPWLIALLLGAAGAAWYGDDQRLSVAILVLIIFMTASDLWREYKRDNLDHHARQLLPSRATVRRNDIAQVIDSAELVVGDIVELEVGMQVPADLRITHADELLIDDGTLLGSSGHNHKYAHTIVQDMSLDHQHNMALAGTTVLSGSGRGVVTATGMQTELGKIVAQAEVARPKQSLFYHSFYRLTRRFGWVAIIALLVLGIIIAQSSLEFRPGVGFGLALIISLVPLGVAVAATRMFAVFGGRAKPQLRISSPSVADRLGNLDTLVLDESSFILEPSVIATSFLVGKKLYRSTNTQLTPEAKLVNEKGKSLSKKTLGELQLFFDALALGTQTRLLPPDGSTSYWHTAGPAAEAAIVSLAAQAGHSVEDVRKQHPLVVHNTFDASRRLASSVRQYDHRQMVFVQGSASSIIPLATRIWDGGHTRKITAADSTRLEAYLQSQMSEGNHVVAVAYRQLTKKAAGAELPMDHLEQDLVILGLVSIGQVIQHSAELGITSLQSLGVAVSLCSNRAEHVAVSTARRLGLMKPRIIADRELAQLSDSQLLDALAQGNTVFMHLTPEQRLRVAVVTTRAGRTLGMTGHSLSDVPALRQAAVALCPTQSPASVSEESDIVLATNDLHALTRNFGRSREISAHLQRVMQSALADHSIQLWTVVASIVLYLTDTIPLAITATLLLVATLLHSLAFMAVGDDATGRNERPIALAPHPSFINVILGVFGAVLLYGNFVLFFMRAGLSPRFIDNSSNLYLQAATLSFVVLSLLMWINLLFARAQHTTDVLGHQMRNKTLLQIFALYLVILIVLVYDHPIQNLVGSRGLSLVDWLFVIVTALAYFTVRVIAHTGRAHSRYAVIALHQGVHGKDSGAKI